MASEKSVDGWMSRLEPSLSPIAEALRAYVVRADPELRESIKWGNPVYEKAGKVCYLASGKGYMSLGFFEGASLSDPLGLIEGTGKRMRHVKVRRVEDIQEGQVASWVREAVALNHREVK